MESIKKAEQFFTEVLSCFKLDSFKAMGSMEMLLIVHDEWHNYLLETKEFGILKNIENMDFFVCTTSKSGIAFKGDLKAEEIEVLNKFEKLYKNFSQLDMNAQGAVLEKFFPES